MAVEPPGEVEFEQDQLDRPGAPPDWRTISSTATGDGPSSFRSRRAGRARPRPATPACSSGTQRLATCPSVGRTASITSAALWIKRRAVADQLVAALRARSSGERGAASSTRRAAPAAPREVGDGGERRAGAAEAQQQLAKGDRPDAGGADQPQPVEQVGAHALARPTRGSVAGLEPAGYSRDASRSTSKAKPSSIGNSRSSPTDRRGQRRAGRRRHPRDRRNAHRDQQRRPTPPHRPAPRCGSSGTGCRARSPPPCRRGTEPQRVEMPDQRPRGGVKLTARARYRCASHTASAPLAASRSRVAAASRFDPVRSTLVAPILPDPMARMSPLPRDPRQQQPERDRPEQIAERQARGAVVLVIGAIGSRTIRVRNQHAALRALATRRASRRAMNPAAPILFFNSGVGGLSVLGADARAAAQRADRLCRRQRRFPLWHAHRGRDRGARAGAARPPGRALSARASR